jgi:hypothetical protein
MEISLHHSSALLQLKKSFWIAAAVLIFASAPLTAEAACPFDCTDLATVTGSINTT